MASLGLKMPIFTPFRTKDLKRFPNFVKVYKFLTKVVYVWEKQKKTNYTTKGWIREFRQHCFMKKFQNMLVFCQNSVLKTFWETTQTSVFVLIRWFYSQKVRIEVRFKVQKEWNQKNQK